MVAKAGIGAIARFGTGVLDFLLPPRCLSCEVEVDRQGTLCARCWMGLRHIGPPLCACCGLPFEMEAAPGALCGACVRKRPVFDRARAPLVYDDGSRSLVLMFKHADRTHAAGAFAAWMERSGAELLGDADLIVPVPLHRWRLFRRRYNQAALLAQALSRRTGVPIDVELLTRHRATRSQGGLDRRRRADNVRNAFRLHGGASGRVRGRRILLIDDVFTTGATLSACARLLRAEGARAVDVLTLARVVRPA